MLLLLVKLAWLPVRLTLGGTWLGLRIGWRTGRFLGPGRILAFVAGAAVGLFAAPATGAELRERFRERLGELRGRPADLGERVRFELAHHPRTWHLPQPDVEAIGPVVTLRGQVADAAAREELEGVAAGVPGVSAVTNLLAVGEPAGALRAGDGGGSSPVAAPPDER